MNREFRSKCFRLSQYEVQILRKVYIAAILSEHTLIDSYLQQENRLYVSTEARKRDFQLNTLSADLHLLLRLESVPDIKATTFISVKCISFCCHFYVVQFLTISECPEHSCYSFYLLWLFIYSN